MVPASSRPAFLLQLRLWCRARCLQGRRELVAILLLAICNAVKHHPALGGAAIPAEEAGDITKIGQNRPKMAQTVAQNGQKCACSAIFGRPGLLSELCELLQGLQSIGAEAGEAALRLTAAFLDLRFGQSRQDATQLSQMPGLRGPNDTLILYEIYVYVIIILYYIYLIYLSYIYLKLCELYAI